MVELKEGMGKEKGRKETDTPVTVTENKWLSVTETLMQVRVLHNCLCRVCVFISISKLYAFLLLAGNKTGHPETELFGLGYLVKLIRQLESNVFYVLSSSLSLIATVSFCPRLYRLAFFSCPSPLTVLHNFLTPSSPHCWSAYFCIFILFMSCILSQAKLMLFLGTSVCTLFFVCVHACESTPVMKTQWQCCPVYFCCAAFRRSLWSWLCCVCVVMLPSSSLGSEMFLLASV